MFGFNRKKYGESDYFRKKDLKFCGENVIIGKNVRIRNPERCYIGNNVIIDDFTYISANVCIEDYVHIGSHVSISGGKGKLYIGKKSTISSHCSIHCASSDYKHFSMDLPTIPQDFQYGGIIGNIKIFDEVVIGSHSVILPSVKFIYEKSAFGAFSLLKDGSYSKNKLYVGIPAKEYCERTAK